MTLEVRERVAFSCALATPEARYELPNQRTPAMNKSSAALSQNASVAGYFVEDASK